MVSSARRRRWLLPAFLVAFIAIATFATMAALAWVPTDSTAAGGPDVTPAAPSPTAGGSSDASGSPDSSSSPNATATKPAPKTAHFTIGAVGDVLPHDTPIREAKTASGYDFTAMLEATKPWSEGVDLAICNMEVPLALKDETPSGYPRFGAPYQIVSNLAGLGWDGCSTGTNHSLDRGFKNLAFTLDEFDKAHLGHAGTARTEAEANTPQVYRLKRAGQEITVAQIGGTYGTNGIPIPAEEPWSVASLDPGRIINEAKKAREDGADLVIATLHWGQEYQNSPNQDQVDLAEELAKSGQIDLIIGNHPHVPQPFAKLDGGPDGSGMWVAYSLGNFISNQDDKCCVPQTGTGLFMTASVEKKPDEPARVTGLSWSPMTVDRVGGQHVYPLTDLLSGSHPSQLTLSASVLQSRMKGVEDVMDQSSGAKFSLKKEPSEPTGKPPAVVLRAKEK